jgi:hypothetical protein
VSPRSPTAGLLQATFIADDRVFFWTEDADLHEVDGVPGFASTRALAGPDLRRTARVGVETRVADALPYLAALPVDAPASDGLRVFAATALLGLELSVRQRVVPTVRDGRAWWTAVVSDAADQQRMRALIDALPPASRSAPTAERGPVELLSADATIRGFLDAAVDGLYRQGAWPGPVRGWPLELARALRGDDATFNPREARHQGIPERLAAWASEAGAVDLQLALALGLPDAGGDSFPLDLWLQPLAGGAAVRVTDAWAAGAALCIDGVPHRHAAWAAVRGLARAARLFPPLSRSLDGERPTDIRLTVSEVRAFVEGGAALLRSAGFAVRLPEAFAEDGQRRLRVRLRLGAPVGGGPFAGQPLPFKWEVTLGDRIVGDAVLAGLLASEEPLVRFDGSWVLLDPADIEQLPRVEARTGELAFAEAIHAVLTGSWRGVPVVADPALEALIAMLQSPPDVAVPAGFVGTLRPYQLRGVAWLAALGRLGLGACLADDMGLGKTVQLIAHLLGRVGTGRPSLVVCPTSVLGNWQRELRRFAPSLRVIRHHGLAREVDAVGDADLVLTTYGLLARDQDELAAVDWDVIALDEAQAIKNPDSQRARAARRLPALQRIALSGTPVENRLDDLWSLMEFLVPGLLGPRTRFHRQVAIPVERFGDPVIAGRLRQAIGPFVTRRLKTDPEIASDLPDKIETRRYCPVTPEQARLYQEVVEEHMMRITASGAAERRGQVLSMLTRLKQVCNHPAHLLGDDSPLPGRSGKLERCADLVANVVANGERALVFTQYREMGVLLQRHLGAIVGADVPFLHGGVPPKGRDDMVAAFQADDGPSVLVISLRAGGTGLNLTRATHVIHYDRWWNPAVEDQATDRAYRLGQHRNVQVHKLVCHDTLEERIDAMLDDKRSLAGRVVGSGDAALTDLDDEALLALVALGADAVVTE